MENEAKLNGAKCADCGWHGEMSMLARDPDGVTHCPVCYCTGIDENVAPPDPATYADAPAPVPPVLTFAEACEALAGGEELQYQSTPGGAWCLMLPTKNNDIAFEWVVMASKWTWRRNPAPAVGRCRELAIEIRDREGWSKEPSGHWRELVEVAESVAKEVLDRARAAWPAYWTNTNKMVDEQLRREFLGPGIPAQDQKPGGTP